MQKIFIAIVALLTMTVSLSAQKKQVSIRIVQDESFVLDKYQTDITLKKKAFRIQVLLAGVEGVYTFAGFTDSICCKLGEYDTIPNLALFPEITMAEVGHNKEKELLVGDSDCSYWYYDPAETDHRFNKKVILLDSNRYVGVKSIKRVYHVPTGKETKIKDLHTPLYLFFVAIDENDAEGRPTKELMRRKVRINWNDED